MRSEAVGVRGSGVRIHLSRLGPLAVLVLVLIVAACSPDGNDAVPPVDPTDARVQALEAELDAANSRWIATVATSARFSPTISRLLAVDALRRSPTSEAWAAMGQLLFADPRRPAELIEVPHGAAVNVVRFSPDSSMLATGADDGTVRLLVAGTDEVVATMGHDDSVADLEFAAEAPFLITAGRDGQAIVWDLDGREVATVDHGDQVNDVAISADGTATATASHDGTSVVTHSSGTVVLEHAGPVWAVDVTADGSVVATGAETDEGGVTRLWGPDGSEIAAFEHDAAPVAVAFSPDDSHLFVATVGADRRLVEVDSASSVATPLAGGDIACCPASGVTWRPDGIEVATYSLAGVFRVQSPGGAALGQFDQPGGERGVAYDTTGAWAVVGSGDFAFSFGVVGVWDLATDTKLVEINAGGPIESLAVSADGAWVAAGFRFADGAEVNGGLVQFAGRDRWLDLACDGNDGIIGASRWAEIVGPGEPFVPGCPGVEAPPPAPDVSTP